MRVIILLLVMVIVGVTAAHAQQPDYAGEIQQTITEWAKQQLTDTIKGIFKISQDEQAEANRLSFGVLIIQVGFLSCYGWLISFIMPGKIAALMRTTAFMGCLQYMADYVTNWLSN